MSAQSTPGYPNHAAKPRTGLKKTGLAVLGVGTAMAVINGLAFYRDPPRTSPESPPPALPPAPLPPPGGRAAGDRAEAIKQKMEYVNATGETLAERATHRQQGTSANPESGGVQGPRQTPLAPKPGAPAGPRRVTPTPKGGGLAGLASAWLAIKEAQGEADRMAQGQMERNDRQQIEQGERQKTIESVRVDNALKAIVIEAATTDHDGWRSVIVRNPTNVDLEGLNVTVLRGTGKPADVPKRIGWERLPRLPAGRSITIRSVARAPFAPAPLLGGKQLSFQRGDTIQVSRGLPAVVKGYTIP